VKSRDVNTPVVLRVADSIMAVKHREAKLGIARRRREERRMKTNPPGGWWEEEGEGERERGGSAYVFG